MKQFSHSKLQTYERCPLNYKFKYLTNLKEEGAYTIEAFLGSRVHETLEKLYRDLLKTKLNSLDDLLKYFAKIWEEEWDDEIVINNKNFKKKHYYNLGKKCVSNYYEKYYPFNRDQTVGIEKQINLKWGEFEIIGYVDRLARDKKGVYSIHDYKTSAAIMEQQYADKDRQLALYSIAVKKLFKEAKEVNLVWHYVAFGEDVISKRTKEELNKLKEEILELIKEINTAEKEDNFPAKETMCDWCGYWRYCPKKKHLYKTEKLPKNEYLKDSGVKLAKKYINLSQKRSEINKRARIKSEKIKKEMEKIEEAILQYSKKNKVETLDGDEFLVRINKKENYTFPTKTADIERYKKLENLLKKSKYWKDLSSVNSAKVSHFLNDDTVDEKLKKQIIALAPLENDFNISIKKK